MLCTKCGTTPAAYNKAQQQRTYERNKDVILERNRHWREANPWKMKAYKLNYRARSKGHYETLTGADIERLFASGRCYDCGATTDLSTNHCIPLFYPLGVNSPENLILQCRQCNRLQGARIHYSRATPHLRASYPIFERAEVAPQ